MVPQQQGVLQHQVRKGHSPKLPRQPTSNTRLRSLSGTNKHGAHRQSKFSNIRLQKYAADSFCMSGYKSPYIWQLARRLLHFQPNWLKITQDRWVLNMIQGYMVDFESQPHQPTPTTIKLLFKSLPCSQERWGTMPGNQPESFKQVCAEGTFQDEGYSHGKRPPETRRLTRKGMPSFQYQYTTNTESFSGLPSKRRPTSSIVYHLACPQLLGCSLKPVLVVLREREG